MATFYIDPTWTGTTSGTEAAPFNSWTQVTWTAGDTYLQKRGTVWDGSGSRITIGVTGTANARITIDAYGESSLPRPKIDGGTTRDIGFFATNHAYITIQNFEICNYTLAGIHFGSTGNDGSIARHIIIKNCHIHNMMHNALGVGIRWWGSDVTVENCLIERCRDDGIWLDGRRATIKNNVIRNVSALAEGGGDCIQYGGNWADGAVIENNLLDRTNNNDKQCVVIRGGLETSISFLIRNNKFLGEITGAGTLSFDTTPATVNSGIIEKNIFFSNKGVAWAITNTGGQNAIIRHNLFVSVGNGNLLGGIAIQIQNGQVYNNTIIGFWRGVEVGNGFSKNNIYLNIGDYEHISNIAANLNNNLKWNIGRPAPLGEGANNIVAEPKFNGSYSLLGSSPGITMGDFVTYTKDLENRFVPKNLSVGCFQYFAPRATATKRRIR